MRRIFKSNAFRLLAVLLVFLIAGSVLAATTHDSTSPVSSAAGVILGPIQRLCAAAAQSMSRLSLKFQSSSYYLEQVTELESELAQCREQLVDYEQTQQKLAFYENFLEVKEENPDYTFVSASIIGRDADDLFGSFTLNKGTYHGIGVDDTVIYNKYLVGVVTSASLTQCTVSTILCPGVNISAYESRTRESGYVETTAALAKDGLCRLSGIERDTTIITGGTVCTSGTGGIYPRDLMIGEVTQIVDAQENISANAEIKPFVDFSKLIDVFIITDFTE